MDALPDFSLLAVALPVSGQDPAGLAAAGLAPLDAAAPEGADGSPLAGFQALLPALLPNPEAGKPLPLAGKALPPTPQGSGERPGLAPWLPGRAALADLGGHAAPADAARPGARVEPGGPVEPWLQQRAAAHPDSEVTRLDPTRPAPPTASGADAQGRPLRAAAGPPTTLSIRWPGAVVVEAARGRPSAAASPHLAQAAPDQVVEVSPVAGTRPSAVPLSAPHQALSTRQAGPPAAPGEALDAPPLETKLSAPSPAPVGQGLSAHQPELAARPSQGLTDLPVPPSHPRFGDELIQRIRVMVEDGVSQVRLRISPPELGALEIRITVADERATVHFTASHATARDALEAGLPRLRELLGAAGLELADGQVAQEDSSANERGLGHSQAAVAVDPAAQPEPGSAEPPALQAVAGSAAGRIDLYA